MPSCHSCGGAIPAVERIGRRDLCLGCGAELHCCANCRFHAPGMHNDCAETQAEAVADKQRSNFCDYFAPASGAFVAPRGRAGSARSRLDELFKKRDP